MSNIESMNCCGTQEIVGIIDDNDPKETTKTVCQKLFLDEDNCAFMIFTDIGKKKPGKNLEKYIKDNKLGKTTKSNSKVNPNSRNSLTVWTWTLNNTALKKWWNENKTSNEY